ncbi:MAG: hypothetical protein DRQ89_13905 [Epsilonproteobacteria bacterium]|nr:MAG: hypothetical protein DRQ89_13905 [Campylobacterota bacterium]
MNEGLEFYRCFQCPQVISVWDMRKQIKESGNVVCPRCGGSKLRPTNLTLIEKFIQIVKHPKIWKWKGVTLNG